jgi:hypothetical protein
MLAFDAPSHVYAWKGAIVPGVTTIIRNALGNPFERVAADVLELARQRGSAVHKACELDDAGLLDEATVDSRIVPYVDAWRVFRHQFKFQVLFAETPLYSMVHGFAGTPDCAIALLDGVMAVLDRKTGLPGPAAAMQTAAYAHLVDCEFGDDGTGLRRFALRMLPTGQYRIHEYTNPGDWRDFLAALTVYRLKERIANE